MEREIEIIENLIKYLQSKIDCGENKIIYDDLMNDEKIVDCITAIKNILKEKKIQKNMLFITTYHFAECLMYYEHNKCDDVEKISEKALKIYEKVRREVMND